MAISGDKKSEELLQRAYDLKNQDETRQLYKDWAACYDDTMVSGLNYSAPDELARIFAEHVSDKTGLIADIGCGTGLTGKAMVENGFDNLVGLDFSDEMLAQAEKTGVYSQLINADLTGQLAIESGRFDAAVSSGIFTYGHLDARCIDEILRIIRVGGVFGCVVRMQVWEKLGFADKFAELEKTGNISVLADVKAANYKNSQAIDGRYLIFAKNAI